MIRRTVMTLLAFALALVATVAATAATAPTASADVSVAAVTITYSDSLAGEFADEVAQGVAIWNASVTNVRIVRAQPGQRVNIRVIADDGWPRATLGPVRPTTSGTVWMGRQAVNQGYNVIRIASHELGHSLGLPDIKPGPCSSLMSGSTAGVSCANPIPNSAERGRVQSLYSGSFTGTLADTGKVVVD